MSVGPDAPGLERRGQRRLKRRATLRRADHAAGTAGLSALRPRGRAFFVLAFVGVPLLLALVVSQVLTDVLWFKEVGQEDAFIRIRTVQVILVLVVGGFTALFLIGNAWLATLRAPLALPRRFLLTAAGWA